MPRPRLILGLALAASALVPSVAQADTWCVGAVAGVTCDHQAPFTTADLEQSISSADSAVGQHTVRVGPGTMTLNFNPAINAGLTLRGAGRTATMLVIPGAAGSVDVTGPGAALRDLSVKTTELTSFVDVIDVKQQATVSGVGVIEASTTPNSQTTTAIAARAGSGAISDVVIDLNSANDAGIQIIDSTTNVTGAQIDGPGNTGIEVLSPGQVVTIDRAKITGMAKGVVVQNAFNTIVRDSLIDLGSTASARGIGTEFLGLSADSAVDVIRTLVVGQGSQQSGLFIESGSTSWDVELRANASVVDLTGSQATDLACTRSGGSGTSSITGTALAFRTQSQTGCGANETSFLNLATEPLRYRDAAARDFRPVYPSSVIDRGASVAPTQTIDLAGQPRFVDGEQGGGAALDLGPYEYQRATPTAPTATTIPATATVGQSLAMTVSGGSDADGDFTEYGWNFGDGGLGVGSTVNHAFAKPGAYTVSVVMRDAAGLESAAVSKTVLVIAPEQPQTPTPTPTPTPAPTPAPTGAGTTGQAIPTLTLLAGPTRALRRGTGGFAVAAARTATTAALTSSTAGTLRLTLQRLVAGRRSGKRCTTSARRGARCTLRKAVKGTATLALPAGTSAVRFGGTFAGRRLPAGRYAVTGVLTSAAGSSRPVTFTLTLR